MNEYYMKMKDLTNRLKKDNLNITGRMIKHYIDIGILQKPIYKCSNQALYADFHYVRLKRILTEKKKGVSIGKIKEDIFSQNEMYEKMALDEGIDSLDASVLNEKYGVMEKEEAYLAKESLNEDIALSKVEVLDKFDLDSSVLDLAVDTGVISDKEYYDAHDIYILICIRNLIKVKKQNASQSGQLLERITEISKIGKIANEIVSLVGGDRENSWLYFDLLESIVLCNIKRYKPNKKNEFLDFSKYEGYGDF